MSKIKRVTEHDGTDMYVIEHLNCPDDEENQPMYLMGLKIVPVGEPESNRHLGGLLFGDHSIGKQWTPDIRDAIFFPHRQGAADISPLVCMHGCARVVEIALKQTKKKTRRKQ